MQWNDVDVPFNCISNCPSYHCGALLPVSIIHPRCKKPWLQNFLLGAHLSHGCSVILPLSVIALPSIVLLGVQHHKSWPNYCIILFVDSSFINCPNFIIIINPVKKAGKLTGLTNADKNSQVPHVSLIMIMIISSWFPGNVSWGTGLGANGTSHNESDGASAKPEKA